MDSREAFEAARGSLRELANIAEENLGMAPGIGEMESEVLDFMEACLSAMSQQAESAEPDAVVSIDQVGCLTIRPILRSGKELHDGQKLYTESQPAAVPISDAVSEFLQMANELENKYPFLYVEIARTRTTDWMAWLREKPGKEHRLIACGQGLKPSEACRDALSKIESPQPPKEGE